MTYVKLQSFYNSGRKPGVLLLAAILVSFLFLKIFLNPLYDDEYSNYGQIKLFLEGNYSAYPKIGVIPGYHFFVSSMGILLGLTQIPQLRIINFIMVLLSFYLFWKTAGLLEDYGSINLKTLQFIFLPVIFPYRFLLYTENLSVPLILGSLFFLHNKRHWLAGLLACLSMLVRQLNVFLVIYLILHITAETMGKQKKLKTIIKNNLINIFGLLAFAGLFIINKGTAIGVQDLHPDFFISPGNLYWALFLFFIMFIPINIANFWAIRTFIRQHKKILIFAMIFIISAVITFTANHPWNQSPEHLRNRLLLAVNGNIITEILFFSAVVYAIFSLAMIKLNRPLNYLIYPLSILSLLPIWLIESRYALLPLLLFMLYRKPTEKRLEYLTLAGFIIFSAYLYYGYLKQVFYF
ncbi:MAG: hypothetical protein UV73_C0002G0137 [Candidatus Gottesmanbacteria bacterium GW2011_GWA2_43_14]|uniref:Uncharacterized protein n=1 Tax=Candidatus Gottesmanbacteria bacterium GW2011_GWA2_43_14 TaxID=1618443 RepID=A0A0G1GI09_9BACT|nr:MAG: hypothetical protein UV73_C0002G0137 [Candidatus Gottesmanbacteria bacterium GW2011_GWA2_43_14]